MATIKNGNYRTKTYKRICDCCTKQMDVANTITIVKAGKNNPGVHVCLHCSKVILQKLTPYKKVSKKITWLQNQLR